MTSEKRAAEQINKTDSETGKRFGVITGEFGRKSTVPYALYRGHGFVSPQLAMGDHGTGFTYADLSLFFQAIQRMFDFDRSASRGLMCVRGLHVFQHSTALGEAPAHVLFDKIVTKPLGRESAARSFEEYKPQIQVLDTLPQGVTYRDLTSSPISADLFPWK